jgi:hypothetical protein
MGLVNYLVSICAVSCDWQLGHDRQVVAMTRVCSFFFFFLLFVYVCCNKWPLEAARPAAARAPEHPFP